MMFSMKACWELKQCLWMGIIMSLKNIKVQYCFYWNFCVVLMTGKTMCWERWNSGAFWKQETNNCCCDIRFLYTIQVHTCGSGRLLRACGHPWGWGMKVVAIRRHYDYVRKTRPTVIYLDIGTNDLSSPRCDAYALADTIYCCAC